jgi:hypothetical protein
VDVCLLANLVTNADMLPMNNAEGFNQGAPIHDVQQVERRIERAAFETDTHLIVGDVTLPPTGYQSRFSDSLNRGDLEFVPLTNVEITSLLDGKVSERPFVMLSKPHIRIAYPLPR